MAEISTTYLLILKRWRREFLPSLNVRHKQFMPKLELAVVDSNARRGEMRMDEFGKPNNLIRVVKVRVGSHVLVPTCECNVFRNETARQRKQ